jgi:hypothetical protein
VETNKGGEKGGRSWKGAYSVNTCMCILCKMEMNTVYQWKNDTC